MKRKMLSIMLGLSLMFSYGVPEMVHAEEGSAVSSEKTEENSSESQMESSDFESEDFLDNSESSSEGTEETSEAEEGLEENELSEGVEVQSGIYNIWTATESTLLSMEKDSGKLKLDKQIYHSRQNFEIISLDDKWYQIQNVDSQLFLEVQADITADKSTVIQTEEKDTDAQKWQFVDAGDGNLYIQSKLGTVLNLSETQNSIEAAVQMNQLDANKTQKWRLDKAVEPNVVTITDGLYQFAGVETDSVLAVDEASKNELKVKPSTYSSTEHFTVTKVTDGWYTITNSSSNMALDVEEEKTSDKAAVQLSMEEDAEEQRFRFIDAGDGNVYIQSELGEYIERDTAEATMETTVQADTLTESTEQKWRVAAASAPNVVQIQSGARYFISSNVNTNMVLDVYKGGTQNGANVQLWREGGGSQQKFIIEVVDANWYRIINEKSKKVLDVASGSKANGANVQQYAWNGTDAQKFRFVDAGNGFCYIQNKLGKYLDIEAAQNKNGANVQMYGLNRTKAQQFKLENLNQTNFIRMTKSDNTAVRMTIFNPSVSATSMSFPTWSRTKGQDDIKWLAGSKNYDNSWTVNIRSKDFRDGGAFDTHIYANGKVGITTKAYTLTKNRTAMEQQAYNILNQVGWNLRAAYNWSVNSIRYQSLSAPPAGANFAEWYAREGFNNRRGNCYAFASTFYYMAKELGYDAHVTVGSVRTVSGGASAHGWVEINMSGTVYVFDPEGEYEIKGYNGYQFRYGNPGTMRYQNYRRVN
ncbi:RICIN domain-containing protein [Enterococcus sp. LJL128]